MAGAAHLVEVVQGISAEGGGASFADRKSVKKDVFQYQPQ